MNDQQIFQGDSNIMSNMPFTISILFIRSRLDYTDAVFDKPNNTSFQI